MNQVNSSDLGKILTQGLALGVIVVDRDCNIICWNRWMEKHSSSRECDMIGQNIFEKYPDILERNKDIYIIQCIENRRSFLLSPYIHHYIIPLDIIRNDQNIRMFQNVKIYPPAHDEESVGAVIIIRDLTEQILHEKEISRLKQILRGIRNIDKLITRVETEDELMEEACIILTEDIGYDFSWIGLLNENSLYIKSAAGVKSEIIAKILEKDFSECAMTCPVIKTGKSQLVNYSQEIFMSTPCMQMKQHDMRIQTACSLPLTEKEHVIGVLHIYSNENNIFHGEELELLEEVASDISFALKMLRDREKQRQAEQEKEKLQEQLRQSQKMEAIGVLAGGIAHDFNNILYPIMGYAELVTEYLPKESTARRKLDEVLSAANRGRDLVQQILTFSRKTEQERHPVKMYLIVKEALRFMRASLPSTIKIRERIAKDSRTVIADYTQIYQVVMNLCTNASHAMEGRPGLLEVALSEEEIDSENAPEPGMKPGSYIKLTVSDTGCGMESTLTERIFEPYFTTKPQGKGTGMGMAVVYGIIMSHYGHIKVYSEPGAGTSVHIYLPQTEEENSAKPEIVPDDPLPTGTEHILLVDDEDQNVRMVQKRLEKLGYSITSSTSSLEILEIFQMNPGNYDLLITDQTMPDMTGAELAVKIMEIRPDFPIILCTGFSEIITEEMAREIGIREYIMKPVSKKIMAMAVRKVLDNRESS